MWLRPLGVRRRCWGKLEFDDRGNETLRRCTKEDLVLGASVMIATSSSSSRRDSPFLVRRVTPCHILLAALLVCFLCASSVRSARATGFLLEDFVEANDAAVGAIVPRLPEAYPGARFLISGFSTPSGTWKFIRVENTSACENETCPTLVVHERVEWKILVLANKRVEVSHGSLNENTLSASCSPKAILRSSCDTPTTKRYCP